MSRPTATKRPGSAGRPSAGVMWVLEDGAQEGAEAELGKRRAEAERRWRTYRPREAPQQDAVSATSDPATSSAPMLEEVGLVYKRLSEVEKCFRPLKTPLRAGPLRRARGRAALSRLPERT